jgi:hypothetical protein
MVKGTMAAYCGSRTELINMVCEKMHFLNVTSIGTYIYQWALKRTSIFARVTI